jgi:hypothetical protein
MARTLIESLAAKGYQVSITGGRLCLTPPGAPAAIVQEVRQHFHELTDELLHVPEHLAGWTLEEMRTLAFRMQSYIDGPAPYEERIRFLPEFERLSERISWRMEATP